MARSASAPPTWEDRLGRIDRRWLYLGLFLFTLIPVLTGLSLPIYPTAPVRKFHQTIEALPTDKLVFISSNWDAGTLPENSPQTKAVFRQLLRRGIPFVILYVGSPNAPQLAQNVLDEALAAETAATGRQFVNGKDYVNTGFKLRNLAWIQSLIRDPVGTLQDDWKGNALKDLPIFAGVDNMKNHVSMLIDITGSNTIDAWVALVKPEGVRVALACTAVMAPEQYPLLASGQLSGLLTGMRGAAEYEKLLGIPDQGTKMMGGQSFAHVYILALIVLGNLGLVARWWARRRRA